MGKAGEFGVCLGDLKKVGCAIVFLRLYLSAYERKKSRCYGKKQRVCVHTRSSQACVHR